MKIKVFANESGIRTENVEESNIQTHIAANDHWSDEAKFLRALLSADGSEAELFEDTDGDLWKKTDDYADQEGNDVLIFELEGPRYKATRNNGGSVEHFGDAEEAAEWVAEGLEWEFVEQQRHAQYVYDTNPDDMESVCFGEVQDLMKNDFA